MAFFTDPIYLSPRGSTGTKITPTTDYRTVPHPVNSVAVQLVVEAVGATPTITWKVQGSYDATRWYDLAYIPHNTDTVASTAITTASPAAGDGVLIFMSNPVARQYKHYAIVVSANTNVTYRAELYAAS